MSDKDLEKELAMYRELAKENPGVDVNMLMMNALQKENSRAAAGKSYKWPYLIAIGVPPLGLIYAVKYWMGGDERDKAAARICVLLTVISLILMYAFGKVMFSASGTSVSQIEQIKPSDIQQLMQ